MTSGAKWKHSFIGSHKGGIVSLRIFFSKVTLMFKQLLEESLEPHGASHTCTQLHWKPKFCIHSSKSALRIWHLSNGLKWKHCMRWADNQQNQQCDLSQRNRMILKTITVKSSSKRLSIKLSGQLHLPPRLHTKAQNVISTKNKRASRRQQLERIQHSRCPSIHTKDWCIYKCRTVEWQSIYISPATAVSRLWKTT